MAIVEMVKNLGNMIMDGFRDPDGVFGPLRDGDEDIEDYPYTEVEPGTSAVRKLDYYTAPVEKKSSGNIIGAGRFAQKTSNEIVFLEPHSFDDVAQIVQQLKDKKIAMLDLHLLDNHQSQRTIDYLCGASQALNVQPKKFGDRVFVFAPSDVRLSADILTEQNKYNDNTMWGTALQ